MTMDALERRIRIWASNRPEIRAILVVGSRASTSWPSDGWADLDLHLFCTNRDLLVADLGWLESIGEVWTWLPERIDDRIPQLSVLFEGGVKVDFAFRSLSVLEGLVDSRQLDEIHDREYTVFLDKDGCAARLPTPQGHLPAGKMPSERDFYRGVNAFWYGAVYVAKQLRRRNLWVAQFRDCTMKELLLQMMEWHARALHGPEYDTFCDGHSLSEWTDAQTWEALHHAFGGFDVAASWEALFQTMDIFRRLATHTALLLGYEYATTLDNRVTVYVQNLRSEMD